MSLLKLKDAMVWFGHESERWASEYDPQRKEAAHQAAVSAAANVIGAELLCRISGESIPEDLKLPDDWRKIAAPLAAERLVTAKKELS